MDIMKMLLEKMEERDQVNSIVEDAKREVGLFGEPELGSHPEFKERYGDLYEVGAYLCHEATEERTEHERAFCQALLRMPEGLALHLAEMFYKLRRAQFYSLYKKVEAEFAKKREAEEKQQAANK